MTGGSTILCAAPLLATLQEIFPSAFWSHRLHKRSVHTVLTAGRAQPSSSHTCQPLLVCCPSRQTLQEPLFRNETFAPFSHLHSGERKAPKVDHAIQPFEPLIDFSLSTIMPLTLGHLDKACAEHVADLVKLLIGQRSFVEHLLLMQESARKPTLTQ